MICHSTNRNTLKLLLLFLLCSFCSYAQHEPDYAAPTGIDKMLFYVQRTTNANTIVYELNESESGILDPDEPILVYWIKYSENGAKVPLNAIQRKYAYGVDVTLTDPEKLSYSFTFQAYKSRPFELRKSISDTKYHVFTTISGKPVMLRNIYVHVTGGTALVPKIKYVRLTGYRIDNGAVTTEKVIP